MAYQVEERGVDGNSPFSGEVPGDASATGSFFCDDGADPCSLDVVDQALDGRATPDGANTAVVPVSFVPASSGCPKGAVVSSESDFGIEGLLTEVAPAACTGTAPTVPVNTAEDSVAAVQALASGAVQIAFTDDPQAADEQAALAGSTGHYDYIPVAASADVVGFSADDAETTRPLVAYPDTSFELTPNMVAGFDNAPVQRAGHGRRGERGELCQSRGAAQDLQGVPGPADGEPDPRFRARRHVLGQRPLRQCRGDRRILPLVVRGAGPGRDARRAVRHRDEDGGPGARGGPVDGQDAEDDVCERRPVPGAVGDG